MANQTFVYDTAANLTPNDYSLTGWTFGGWNTRADYNTTAGTHYANSASVNNLIVATSTTASDTVFNLYAEWTQNTYSVKFEKNKPSTANGFAVNATNNVSGSMANQTFTYDAAEVKLTVNDYELKGWTFTGWNTNEKYKVEKKTFFILAARNLLNNWLLI